MRRPEFTTDQGGRAASSPDCLTCNAGFPRRGAREIREGPMAAITLSAYAFPARSHASLPLVKAELLALFEKFYPHVAWVLAENAAFRHHRESHARAIANFAKSQNALLVSIRLRGQVIGARATVVTRRSVISRSAVSSWRWCFERLSRERSAKKAAAPPRSRRLSTPVDPVEDSIEDLLRA